MTNYAGLIIESATDILNQADLNDKVYNNLWHQVLGVLQETFEHDQDGEQTTLPPNPSSNSPFSPFVPCRKVTLSLVPSPALDFFQSPTHFYPLSTALLSQFPRLASTPKLTLSRTLINTITAFASAIDSSTPHHRTLNAGILTHFRSDDAAVRLAAVKCQRSLTRKLGEEWLAQLPEMLPFVSEALEDDDEDVENEVRAWIVEIEACLGESVEEMLQ